MSIHISYGQLIITNKRLEQQKDSAFAVLFNTLWAELEIRAKSKDTTIVLTAQDMAFYYDNDTISDASLSESLLIPVPKFAHRAARYFEIKTSFKRPSSGSYFPTPYLTYHLIKKWEKWYESNKNKIDYSVFVDEINKLKND